MIIGIPKEIKNNENRVGMTPAGVQQLVKHGHTVLVQATAGEGSGFSDADFVEAGAAIEATIEDVYGKVGTTGTTLVHLFPLCEQRSADRRNDKEWRDMPRLRNSRARRPQSSSVVADVGSSRTYVDSRGNVFLGTTARRQRRVAWRRTGS